MFRSLKSLYFSNRKNYTFNEDFIISDFIISENKVSFKLLTFFDDFGIEEFIILDKQLHEPVSYTHLTLPTICSV